MWENWSPVGFLITPVVVSVYVCVRESEVGREQNSEEEPQDVRREKRICDYTQNSGQVLFLRTVRKYRRVCLKLVKDGNMLHFCACTYADVPE